MELERCVKLSPFTSIKVGGVAKYFASPKNVEEIKELIGFCRDKDMPLLVLGGGSNTIPGDIEGLVLNLSRLRGVRVRREGETYLVKTLAGTPLRYITGFAVRENLAGIYRLAGFPATVGGAVAMNAGAFGVEIKDFLEEVSYVSWEGELVSTRKAADLLSYRSSPFPKRGIVVSCTFRLRRSPSPVVEDYRRVREIRRNTQPIGALTSGSTFKNPLPFYAGKLLESVGLKGFRIGDLLFSTKHANFLINRGKATYGDVEKIIEEAKRRVFEEFGILLEEEVRLVEGSGFDGWKVL